MRYQIYTDGACSNNGAEDAAGGWAYVILDEQEKVCEYAQSQEIGTTNQRMELQAIIHALKRITDNTYPAGFFVCEIHSDSAYCINAINDKWIVKWRSNGWVTSARQPVKNQDLWKELYDLYAHDERFVFKKVKGHSDNRWNNYVDELAQEAKNGIQPK